MLFQPFFHDTPHTVRNELIEKIIPYLPRKSNRRYSENQSDESYSIRISYKNSLLKLCRRENRHEQTVNFSENSRQKPENVGRYIEGFCCRDLLHIIINAEIFQRLYLTNLFGTYSLQERSGHAVTACKAEARQSKDHSALLAERTGCQKKEKSA